MVLTNNFDVSNLRIFKRILLSLILICSLIQFFLISNFQEIINLVLLIISNLAVIIYCLDEKKFIKYPISLLVIFWSHFFFLGGALFFKTIELENISHNLRLPYETILLLTIANFAIILSHMIYRKTNLFIKSSNFLNRLNFKLDIMNIKDNNFLYFCGAIAIVWNIFYSGPNVPLYKIARGCWSVANVGCGPTVFQDISQVFNLFIILPFLVYISFYLFNKKKEKTKTILILIFFIAVIYGSVGFNARGPLYEIILKFILIFILIFLLDKIKINKNKVLKYVVVFMISIYSLTYIESITRLYVYERAFAPERSPIENVKSFYQNIKNTFDNRQKFELYSLEIENRLRGGFDRTERYYDSNLLERINSISFSDDLNYASSFLNKKQKNMMIEYQANRIISILPQPVISLFSKSFNKQEYLTYGLISYMYRLMRPGYSGTMDMGTLFGVLKIFYGYYFLILLIPLSIVSFIIFDSFYDSKNITFSPIILMYFYLSSGSALTFFSTPSLDINLYILIRGIPQTIVLYLIMKIIYEKFFTFKVKKF